MAPEQNGAAPEVETIRVVCHSGERTIPIAELHANCAWYWRVGPALVVSLESVAIVMAVGVCIWCLADVSLVVGLVLAVVIGGLLGLAMATAQGSYLSKVMRWGIKCPECQSYIGHDMEWVCGHCGYANVAGADREGLFEKCWKCGCVPKSVQCPGCEVILALDGNHDIRNPARRWQPPPEPGPEPAVVAEQAEVEAHQAQVRKLQRQRDLLKEEVMTGAAQQRANRLAAELVDPSGTIEKEIAQLEDEYRRKIVAAAEMRVRAEKFKAELRGRPGFAGLPDKKWIDITRRVDEAVARIMNRYSSTE